MTLLVQKFGGSCVRDAAHIRRAAELVVERVRGGDQVVVTVSAMGSETDELFYLAPKVADVPQLADVHTGPEMDMLVTAGERKSAALLCLALQHLGVSAEPFSGGDAGIVTDTRHTCAGILEVRPGRLRASLDAGCVPVVSGAQGVSTEGRATFLGRGSTDTTAVALATALEAPVCELYTDVAGVYTANPQMVPEAQLLPRLNFAQMLAMCEAGCPKPATEAVRYAQRSGISLRVRSADAPHDGTLIGSQGARTEGCIAIVADPISDGSQVRVTLVNGHAESDSRMVAAETVDIAVRSLHRAFIEGTQAGSSERSPAADGSPATLEPHGRRDQEVGHGH